MTNFKKNAKIAQNHFFRLSEGFQKGKVLKKVGQHTYDTAELFFEDVRVPSSAILGGVEYMNKGFYCFKAAFGVTMEFRSNRGKGFEA